MEKAGIRSVVNLQDSEDHMKEYETYPDSYYSGCAVVNPEMNYDFLSPEFGEFVKKSVVFLTENEGPYLIHCREGGGGQRVFVPYYLNCTGIITGLYHGYISRYIHMSRTQSDTWNRLTHIFHAAPSADVAFVFISKLIQRIKYQVCAYYSYCTIGGLCDHAAFLCDCPYHTLICLPAYNGSQQIIHFCEPIPAGYAFAAGLIHRYL